MKILILILSFTLAGCALTTPLDKVRAFTRTAAPPPRITSGESNYYLLPTYTIHLDVDGLRSEHIQIHEHLHWAFDTLTYAERQELFAVWGTYYIEHHNLPGE